jgi:sporulation protein YlmC with PRC-barrel domain
MRVDLGANVRTSDGESAGRVHRAIINPYTSQVTEFVISTAGVFGHDVLVPRERLEASTREGNEIVLDLTGDELKALQKYTPADYTEPDPGWLSPVEYGYPATGYLFPASTDWRQELDNQDILPEKDPEVWPDLKKGAVVRDRNGHDIGRVDEIWLDDDTGQLERFVIRAGGAIQTFLGGGETRVIDVSDVVGISTDQVVLRLDRQELAGHSDG